MRRLMLGIMTVVAMLFLVVTVNLWADQNEITTATVATVDDTNTTAGSDVIILPTVCADAEIVGTMVKVKLTKSMVASSNTADKTWLPAQEVATNLILPTGTFVTGINSDAIHLQV